MTIREAERNLAQSIRAIYDARESAAIADHVMEHLLGWNKVDRILQRDSILSPPHSRKLAQYREELLAGRPMQYVIHEAWFRGMRLYVDERVLIPRPETEELVEWVLHDAAERQFQACKVLDVGTGSGCIAIALQKKWPAAEIHACDTSAGALAVARKNAKSLHARVHWQALDFLNATARENLPVFDLLVSNPPYIPRGAAHSVDNHVLRFEPRQALFVEDDRPLIFYETMAGFARTHLNPQGSLYAEMHEGSAPDVAQVFRAAGLAGIQIRKDMQGKERLIKATRLL